MHQVVFQITSSEVAAHQSMLGQLHNLLQYFEEKVQVEVVVHGAAWPLLLSAGNPLAEKVTVLHQRGVQWLICRNTLDSHQLEMELLLPFTRVVAAGVGHLVERQAQGWAYIKS